jgi:hypothetical protein
MGSLKIVKVIAAVALTIQGGEPIAFGIWALLTADTKGFDRGGLAVLAGVILLMQIGLACLVGAALAWRASARGDGAQGILLRAIALALVAATYPSVANLWGPSRGRCATRQACCSGLAAGAP